MPPPPPLASPIKAAASLLPEAASAAAHAVFSSEADVPSLPAAAVFSDRVAEADVPSLPAAAEIAGCDQPRQPCTACLGGAGKDAVHSYDADCSLGSKKVGALCYVDNSCRGTVLSFSHAAAEYTVDCGYGQGVIVRSAPKVTFTLPEKKTKSKEKKRKAVEAPLEEPEPADHATGNSWWSGTQAAALLLRGVVKHGTAAWTTILNDPEFQLLAENRGAITTRPEKSMANKYHYLSKSAGGSVQPPTKPRIGLLVEADYQQSGDWYRGKITRYDPAEGLFAVAYDDGDAETGILGHNIHWPPGPRSDPDLVSDDDALIATCAVDIQTQPSGKRRKAYTTPDGTRFRSRVETIRYLRGNGGEGSGDDVDADDDEMATDGEDDLAALRKENAELRKAHAQMSAVYKLTEGRESAWLAYKAQAETVHAQQVADLGRLREQLRDARLGAY